MLYFQGEKFLRDSYLFKNSVEKQDSMDEAKVDEQTDLVETVQLWFEFELVLDKVAVVENDPIFL